MVEDNSMQKRAFLAIILTLMFFIGYDHFYLSNFKDKNQTSAQTTSEYDAPKTTSTKNVSATNEILTKPETNKKAIAVIESEYFTATIDELGRISSFVLSDSVYADKDGNQLNLISSASSPLPLELRFSNSELNKKAFEIPYTASSSKLDLKDGAKSLVLTQDLGDVVITKTLTMKDRGDYELSIELNQDEPYFIAPGMRPDILADRLAINGVLLREADSGNLEVVKDGKVDKGGESFVSMDIISSFDRYYAIVFYNFETPMNVVVNEDESRKINQAFVTANGNFYTYGYIGPKNKKLLEEINPELTNIIEYGFFTFLAKPMFSFLSLLKDLTGNWGWAIVLMTISVRLVLAPFTIKGMVSMSKLKDVAPKIKEIQEKYKDEPKKAQSKVMEVYKESGANPMGGCLPVI
ncbi:MAG: membrane protein insertase YidC, partial [Campylobacter sp.]|nr:membrane protein insertase YidC [Campylobacter sp.]